MSWYQFLIPAVAFALLVRLEAVLVGPYWSWLEMFPEVEDESQTTKTARRRSFWRRVAIPGLGTFVLALLWPDHYSEWESAVVGLGVAFLLLWPIVFHGLPWGVRSSDWQMVLLYGGLLLSFASSSWLGAHLSLWASNQEGGVAEVLRENIFGLLIGAIIVGGATSTQEFAAERASRLRNKRMNEF